VKYRIEYVRVPDYDAPDYDAIDGTGDEYLDLVGRRIVQVLGEPRTGDGTVLLRVLTEETDQ
jgi:hypothetical protein